MTPTTLHAPATAPRGAGRRAARAALALSLVAASACDRVDRLLAIETPSRLAENTLLVPENAQLLVTSAVGDFQCAHGSYIVASALGASELTDASQTAARWSYDRRAVLPSDALYSTAGCTGLGVYTPLSIARSTNDQALRLLDGWTDEQVEDRQRLIATAAAFSGYSFLLLGEGFCSAAVAGGPEVASTALFDSAEVRFTRAMTEAQAAGETDLLNLARVGRARARLNLGNTAGAAEDAAQVPVDFAYALDATEVDGRYVNRVYAQNNAGTVTTVAASYRGLTVQGAPDPRVQVVDEGEFANDGLNPLFRELKYESLIDDIPVATGVQAQLILAEARGAGEGVGILNALRARHGLPGLTAGEQAAFTATLFEERRRELWLQGTRWYDIRRGDLSLVPAAGTPYSKGGVYGDQRCWPLPDVERLSNPNIPDQG